RPSELPKQVDLVQGPHHRQVLDWRRCRLVVDACTVDLQQFALLRDRQLALLVDQASSFLGAQRFSALDKKSRSMVSSPSFAKSSFASASLSRLRSAAGMDRPEPPSSNCRFQAPIWLACTPYSRDNSARVFSSRAASKANLALNSGE